LFISGVGWRRRRRLRKKCRMRRRLEIKRSEKRQGEKYKE
jgi:hypothetical protein